MDNPISRAKRDPVYWMELAYPSLGKLPLYQAIILEGIQRKVAMDNLETLYERWSNLACRYDADKLTRGQKAALSRAWNRFAEKASELGYDPFRLSEKWAQP
jgi:hypothetical protein